jgi:hypothetical protein
MFSILDWLWETFERKPSDSCSAAFGLEQVPSCSYTCLVVKFSSIEESPV